MLTTGNIGHRKSWPQNVRCRCLSLSMNCVYYGLKGCINLQNEKNNIKEERNINPISEQADLLTKEERSYSLTLL